VTPKVEQGLAAEVVLKKLVVEVLLQVKVELVLHPLYQQPELQD
jgi:hypothetical protein